MLFELINLFSNEILPGSNFQGGHGQSFFIKISNVSQVDSKQPTHILFDVGASSKKLLHNMQELRISPESIKTLILSHGHYDHTDALPGYLKSLPADHHLHTYAHPDVKERKFLKLLFLKLNLGFPRIKEPFQSMLEFHYSSEPVEIASNLWFSGEIRERPYITGVEPSVFHKSENGLEVDPVHDDASVYLRTDSGIVIITGCAHAGILNIALHAKKLFNEPIRAIIGGSHMVRYSPKEVEDVASILKNEFGNPMLYLNHCTDHLPLPVKNRTPILQILKSYVGEDHVNPCYVGTKLSFNA
ncbi:MAG: MBL fold metallo-hydrolase [Candidatus Lokiarchaeota archaeon]|nr:MBL fold metallo-hydrolase [Candidatus Harpocratesius repetitus]